MIEIWSIIGKNKIKLCICPKKCIIIPRWKLGTQIKKCIYPNENWVPKSKSVYTQMKTDHNKVSAQENTPFERTYRCAGVNWLSHSEWEKMGRQSHGKCLIPRRNSRYGPSKLPCHCQSVFPGNCGEQHLGLRNRSCKFRRGGVVIMFGMDMYKALMLLRDEAVPRIDEEVFLHWIFVPISDDRLCFFLYSPLEYHTWQWSGQHSFSHGGTAPWQNPSRCAWQKSWSCWCSTSRCHTSYCHYWGILGNLCEWDSVSCDYVWGGYV